MTSITHICASGNFTCSVEITPRLNFHGLTQEEDHTH